MAPIVSLEEAVATVQQRYGPAALRPGADPVPGGTWPTCLPLLDHELLDGGLPRGRITVIEGSPPAGAPHATTGRLAVLHAILAMATRDGLAVYVDIPSTVNPGDVADAGGDVGNLLVVRPPGGHVGQGLAIARSLLRAGAPFVGIVLPNLLRGRASWTHPLTALVQGAWSTRAVVCFSACRPLPAPLAYASSLTLNCSRHSWLEHHGVLTGLQVTLSVSKSKISAPGASAKTSIRYARPYAVPGSPGVVSLIPDKRDPAFETFLTDLERHGRGSVVSPFGIAGGGMEVFDDSPRIDVELDNSGAPTSLRLPGRRLLVTRVTNRWVADIDWWRQRIARSYYEVIVGSGEAAEIMWVFQDTIASTWHLAARFD